MARSFNGSSDNIDVGVAAALEIVGDFTASAWIKTSSAAAAVWLGCYDSSGSPFTGYGLGMGIVTAGRLSFWNNATGSWQESSATVNDGNWRAVGFSRTGATLTFYIDGAASGTLGALSNWGAFTGSKKIGASSGGGNVLSGALAELAVWNVGLTADEMKALALGRLPFGVRPGSLQGYWPLWGLHSPEPDLSGNGNGGTLTGTAQANHAPATTFTRKSRTTVEPAAADVLMAQACL